MILHIFFIREVAKIQGTECMSQWILFMLKSDSQAQRKRQPLLSVLRGKCRGLPSSSAWVDCAFWGFGLLQLRMKGFFPSTQRITWTFFIHLSLGEIYDLFNVRKFCFSWHFIALRIWNISIPDNKYYVIIVFIWIGYFLLFFSKPLSQLIMVKNLLILNCAIQLFRNHV